MIGEAMRLIRIIEGIKAITMAKELGISPSYLSLIENNKKRPSIELIEKFAGVIGVRASQVMFFYEELDSESNVSKDNKLSNLTKPTIMKWLRKLAIENEND
jgi:transcriptional regulator with XRE-family HTH domain